MPKPPVLSEPYPTANVVVKDSWLFCESCETNYREVLVRFADGSVFTLCTACVTDLRIVIELFDLECSITRM